MLHTPLPHHLRIEPFFQGLHAATKLEFAEMTLRQKEAHYAAVRARIMGTAPPAAKRAGKQAPGKGGTHSKAAGGGTQPICGNHQKQTPHGKQTPPKQSKQAPHGNPPIGGRGGVSRSAAEPPKVREVKVLAREVKVELDSERGVKVEVDSERGVEAAVKGEQGGKGGATAERGVKGGATAERGAPWVRSSARGAEDE